MPKVLIADKLSPAAVAIFKERGVDADVKTGLTKEELIKIVDQYDGIAIRSATKLTADVLKAAKNLKVVGRAGIGVDNVDIPAATAAGVIVMNTPFGNSITTADMAGLMADIEAMAQKAAPGLVFDVQQVDRLRPAAMAEVLMQAEPFFIRALPGRILN